MFIRNFSPFAEAVSTPLILIPVIIIISFSWYLFFEKLANLIRTCKCILNPVVTVTIGFRYALGSVLSKNRSSVT